MDSQPTDVIVARRGWRAGRASCLLGQIHLTFTAIQPLITAPFASYSAVQLSMHCYCAVRRDNEEKNHPFHKKQQEWCDELHEMAIRSMLSLLSLKLLDSPSLSRGSMWQHWRHGGEAKILSWLQKIHRR